MSADPRDYQQRAADAHARTTLLRVGPHLPGGSTTHQGVTTPAFVTAWAEATNAAIQAETLKVCPHAQLALNRIAPTPLVGAAWRPGMIVCLERCRDALAVAAGSDADKTCDGCGVVSARGLKVMFMELGNATLLMAGLCRACYARFRL